MLGDVKKCPTCGESKSLDEFSNNRARRDGKHGECKTCKAARSRDWFDRNPAAISASTVRKEQRRREYIWAYLLSHPCVDCGETDPLVLEFDHVRGQKEIGICDMIRKNISHERFLDEIEKCDVRCANCHRRVTQVRGGHWRTLMMA